MYTSFKSFFYSLIHNLFFALFILVDLNIFLGRFRSLSRFRAVFEIQKLSTENLRILIKLSDFFYQLVDEIVPVSDFLALFGDSLDHVIVLLLKLIELFDPFARCFLFSFQLTDLCFEIFYLPVFDFYSHKNSVSVVLKLLDLLFLLIEFFVHFSNLFVRVHDCIVSELFLLLKFKFLVNKFLL